MAKSKSRARANNNSKKNNVTKRVRKTKGGLDEMAAAYVRLLTDPCGAPLTHPIYPGGDSGFLVRSDSVWTTGNGVNESCGYVHWTPGYVNASHTELLSGVSATSNVNVNAAPNATGPGKFFLAQNAFGVRCVAACLKISYPGAEQARSGRLHYGHTPSSTLDSGDSLSVDSLAPLLQHYTRTPPEHVEVFWRPGIADTEFTDPNTTASQHIRDRKSAITVAWAGLPAGVGLTFHFTCVYEWTPRPSSGVSNNVAGKARSRNSMDDVIDYIQAAGFTWVKNAAAAATHGVLAAATTAMSSTFGLMAARPMRYSTSRLLT